MFFVVAGFSVQFRYRNKNDKLYANTTELYNDTCTRSRNKKYLIDRCVVTYMYRGIYCRKIFDERINYENYDHSFYEYEASMVTLQDGPVAFL